MLKGQLDLSNMGSRALVEGYDYALYCFCASKSVCSLYLVRYCKQV